jgi:hypothetical protein
MGEKRVIAKPQIPMGDSNSPFIMRDFAAKTLLPSASKKQIPIRKPLPIAGPSIGRGLYFETTRTPKKTPIAWSLF